MGQKGLTLIPLNISLTETGLIKMLIGVCKGKNKQNKKQAIKLRDLDREVGRNI